MATLRLRRRTEWLHARHRAYQQCPATLSTKGIDLMSVPAALASKLARDHVSLSGSKTESALPLTKTAQPESGTVPGADAVAPAGVLALVLHVQTAPAVLRFAANLVAETGTALHVLHLKRPPLWCAIDPGFLVLLREEMDHAVEVVENAAAAAARERGIACRLRAFDRGSSAEVLAHALEHRVTEIVAPPELRKRHALYRKLNTQWPRWSITIVDA